MNRSQKVCAIYKELMSFLEGDLPRRQVLSLAAELLQRHEEANGDDGYELGRDDPLSGCEALDVALADGGWRLRARERLFNDTHFEEDPYMHERSQNTLRTLMQRAA